MSTVSAKGSCSPPAPFFGYGTGSSRLEVPEVFEAPAWKGGRFGQRLCTRVDGQYAAGPWLTCFSTRDSFFKAWCKASGVWCPNYILYVYTHTHINIYIYIKNTSILHIFSNMFFVLFFTCVLHSWEDGNNNPACFIMFHNLIYNEIKHLRNLARIYCVYIYICSIHTYIYAQYIHIHIYI